MIACKICQAEVYEIGKKTGRLDSTEYRLLHCPKCQFSFVANPRRDFERIYSEAYYGGNGADPFVDYINELANPDQSVRTYEWMGILSFVQYLWQSPLSKETSWLDYGCGNGGLIRYVQTVTNCKVIGFDEGWIIEKAHSHGIPVTHNMDDVRAQGNFDVITAIEVLEHVEDPLKTLKEIRSLLKPGGLFFYTTGNAFPYRNNLLNWRYFIPEIHISLYESESLMIALGKTGFRCENVYDLRYGWSDIYRFKALKTIGIRRKNIYERMLPWRLIAALMSRISKINHHPIAWALE